MDHHLGLGRSWLLARVSHCWPLASPGMGQLWIALFVLFVHVVPNSAGYSVLPTLLLPLVHGDSAELAHLIGALSLASSAASLLAIPLLSAASDGGLGRKNVILLGLSVDFIGELLLSISTVRASKSLLLLLAGLRAVSAIVAVGETVILLHPPVPVLGVSTGINRGVIKMTVSSMARPSSCRCATQQRPSSSTTPEAAAAASFGAASSAGVKGWLAGGARGAGWRSGRRM